MKKMMFIPVLLTLFASLQADHNQSSVYGTTNPTYAPKTGIVTTVPDIISSPIQTQIYQETLPQTGPYYQEYREVVPGYNSGLYQDPNNPKFSSDVRSNPGEYGQHSYIQGQELQGTYYQGQNLQGTYNQNQYEKQLYQNQILHDQYQRGQGSFNNNNMQYQPVNPSHTHGQIRNLEAMNEQNVYSPNQSHPANSDLKSSASDKHPQDKYATESDRDINLKIRKKITGWFTDDYTNISIVTDNGKTFIDGFVDNQDAQNTLQKDAKYIQPNVSFNVQVRSNKP